MKISKNKRPIKACDEIVDVAALGDATSGSIVSEATCKYCNAIEYIKNAISDLAIGAGEDPIALDAIANLSVVLLDLKG